jgi:hypothetical protein
MSVLGIDFGTSNTVAVLRTPEGRTRPLLFDGSPLLPSAVYQPPDGPLLVGRDAQRHARVDPSRYEPNPKRRIDDGTVLLGGTELAVPQVFSAVLSTVAVEARRQAGGQLEQVYLTHPARWGEQRRRLLVEALRLAGLSGPGGPQLVPEPVAAASYFTAVLRARVPVGRSLAIYDLGGGTFDAAVVRRTPAGFQVLAEDGLTDVGGLDFDHEIVEHLGRTCAVSHPTEWAALTRPVDGGQRRARQLLYEDVRAAKETLSRAASVDLPLPLLDVDAHLTRSELETLIRPHLDRTVNCLAMTITAAGLAPTDLVGIFLVGGSSRIPLAAHLIHSELQVAPTTLEQPETVVVEGVLCLSAPAGAPPVSPAPVGADAVRAGSGGPVSGGPAQGARSGAPVSGGAAPGARVVGQPGSAGGPVAPGRPVSGGAAGAPVRPVSGAAPGTVAGGGMVAGRPLPGQVPVSSGPAGTVAARPPAAPVSGSRPRAAPLPGGPPPAAPGPGGVGQPVRPVSGAAAGRPANQAVPRPPVLAAPVQRQVVPLPVVQQRRYQQPAFIGLVAVLTLAAVLFVILLVVIFSG